MVSIRVGHIGSVALLLLTAVACGTAPSDDAAAMARALSELRVADSSVSAAIAARDAERTARFYTDDAVIMPVAEPIVEGRVAILEEWRHVFGIPGYANNSRLVASAVSAAADLGYTRGTYESPMLDRGGKPVVERGKWVSVWKRETDGTWRIVLDIFNTDSPPPDHQPSKAERREH
jgi:ketosteroid isomerase-like protein